MIGWLVGLLGVAVIAATAVSFASHWGLALFAHFRPHLGAAALALAVLAALIGVPYGLTLWLTLVLLATAAVDLYGIRHALPRERPQPAAGAPRLTIAFANLFIGNRQYRRMVDWLRREQPDLFIACEAYHAWPQELAELADIYPMATREPFGDIVVLSRWPAVTIHHAIQGRNGHAVVLEVDSEHGPLTVVALHTMVPWFEEPMRGRYHLIGEVAELIVERQSDLIVLGDFNATPWSRPMRRLVERAGLAFAPGSWRGSFPAWLPTWMGLPIDHVLGRGGWRVASRRPGPRLGSDHWPVVAEVVYVAERAGGQTRAQARGNGSPASRSAPVSASRARKAGASGPPSSHSA